MNSGMSRLAAASGSRVDGIDGLRAVAMTMVIAQHCGLLPFGWTGVWLFYVISGYVITRGFIAEDAAVESAGRGARAVAFLQRRALRIVPVYLLYVAVNILLLLALHGPQRLGDVPWLLGFAYNWHMIFGFPPGSSNWGPFGHLWTLSVEQQFYLLFPLLALWVAPRLRISVTIALVAAGPLVRWAWSQWLLSTPIGDDPGWLAFAVYAASHCHFDAFLAGSLIARLEPRLRHQPWLATRLAWAAMTGAVAYAAVYVAINAWLGASGIDALRNVYSGILWGQHREVFGYVAVNLVAAALLVHVLLDRPGTRSLAMAPIAWVGRVSYGGYLFHALVLWGAGQGIGGPVKELPLGWRLLAFAAVLLVTVALASASFRWFETPVARRWRGRLPSVAMRGRAPHIQGAP